MKLDLIARRYAEAFLSYAKETIGFKKAIEETRLLKKTMQDSPEFIKILMNPALSVREKFAFIDDIFKDHFSQEFLAFLKLIIESRRVLILEHIINYLIINYSKEEVQALIKSVYPLREQTVKEIEKKLERKLKKKIHFSVELDKHLIGGIRVEIGNTVFDGSLSGYLKEFKERIKFIEVV